MSIQKSNKYDDIINLPHHQSETRPHMSLSERAAQFSPFAALSGYGESVKEEARLTFDEKYLSEEKKEDIRQMLNTLNVQRHFHPEITIHYFIPDKKKQGGAYSTTQSQVKKIDGYAKRVILYNGLEIPFADIIDIVYDSPEETE